MRQILVITGLVAFAAPAFAQGAGSVVSALRKDAPCSGVAAARPVMDANIGKITAPAADIDAALATITADTSICSALRDAARDIAAARTTLASTATTTAPPITGEIAATSREAVAAALAEGERRAASLKFEVGPPPPNLTKGRYSSP